MSCCVWRRRARWPIRRRSTRRCGGCSPIRASSSLVTNFAFQWLKMRGLDEVEPDAVVFPNFDDSLREGFRKEMAMFVESIIREDRSVLDLLTADYTFVNERLALHYGIPNVRGDQFRRVTLADQNRWGLLGKGGVLLSTSYANRTAPVIRGAWILENILGTPPAAPPPDVEAFPENKDGEKAKTIRAIMEQHRAKPTCNACHGVMDPLGLRARELRRDRRVARAGPLGRHSHRRVGAADRRHEGERSGRSAQGAAQARPTVRADIDRKADDLRARPERRVLRHADGPADRPRRRARQLSVFIAGDGDREERPVPDAQSAGSRARVLRHDRRAS